VPPLTPSRSFAIVLLLFFSFFSSSLGIFFCRIFLLLFAFLFISFPSSPPYLGAVLQLRIVNGIWALINMLNWMTSVSSFLFPIVSQ